MTIELFIGSLINFNKSSLIEPSQFKDDLIKIYDSNTGENSSHDHSHATYSMIWELSNYLNTFQWNCFKA